MTILDYPRWRSLVLELNGPQFEQAWLQQFGAMYAECSHGWDGEEYIIETPYGWHRFSDWHYEYTDQPVLGMGSDVVWQGGNSLRYAYDLIGQPYWLLDPKTGYPRNFEAIVRIEMIKRYMKQNNL